MRPNIEAGIKHRFAPLLLGATLALSKDHAAHATPNHGIPQPKVDYIGRTVEQPSPIASDLRVSAIKTFQLPSRTNPDRLIVSAELSLDASREVTAGDLTSIVKKANQGRITISDNGTHDAGNYQGVITTNPAETIVSLFDPKIVIAKPDMLLVGYANRDGNFNPLAEVSSPISGKNSGVSIEVPGIGDLREIPGINDKPKIDRFIASSAIGETADLNNGMQITLNSFDQPSEEPTSIIPLRDSLGRPIKGHPVVEQKNYQLSANITGATDTDIIMWGYLDQTGIIYGMLGNDNNPLTFTGNGEVTKDFKNGYLMLPISINPKNGYIIFQTTEGLALFRLNQESSSNGN